MPQLHETLMGKRFMEGTIPQLTRAVNELTKTLKDQSTPEYITYIATLFVKDGYRKELENIENQKFDSIEAITEINPNISVYSMSDFMDMCNNEDSDFLLENESILKDRWIGYIQLKKGVL